MPDLTDDKLRAAQHKLEQRRRAYALHRCRVPTPGQILVQQILIALLFIGILIACLALGSP